MADNPKNKLQIHCQRSKLEIPKYVTVRSGGTDNAPIWKSEVIIGELKGLGNESQTKSQAEMSAATQMLELINKTENLKISDETSVNNNDIKTNFADEIKTNFADDIKTSILLIDGENLHKLADMITEAIARKFDIYLYVGEHHHLRNKSCHPWIKKRICAGYAKDLVDTCIQLDVGGFLVQNRYTDYWIASRDHFAFTLMNLIKNDMMGWTPQKSRIITEVSHFAIEYRDY